PPLLFFRPPLPPPHTPLPSPPLFRSLPQLPQPGPPVHVVPTRNHRPPSQSSGRHRDSHGSVARADCGSDPGESPTQPVHFAPVRSEEHTSELQSRENLVCRLLLEKQK